MRFELHPDNPKKYMTKQQYEYNGELPEERGQTLDQFARSMRMTKEEALYVLYGTRVDRFHEATIGRSTNDDIRAAARAAGIALWQIAYAEGISDGAFSRKLRSVLPADEKQRILRVIKRLKLERRNMEDSYDD